MLGHPWINYKQSFSDAPTGLTMHHKARTTILNIHACPSDIGVPGEVEREVELARTLNDYVINPLEIMFIIQYDVQVHLHAVQPDGSVSKILKFLLATSSEVARCGRVAASLMVFEHHDGVGDLGTS